MLGVITTWSSRNTVNSENSNSSYCNFSMERAASMRQTIYAVATGSSPSGVAVVREGEQG